MLKKILIGLGVVVVLLAAAYFYLDYRNYSLSPKGTATLTNGDLQVDVTYCRPSVRERVIFGAEGTEAIQPYGKYWRLGANESTEITFNQDVYFNGKPAVKGTYRMYAIPGAEEFEIRLNTELGQWGAFAPDSTLDVASTFVPVLPNSHVEQFTISMEPWETNGVSVIFEWSNVRFEVPVEIQ